jgi:2-hydroxy-3-keto-5-methylthiopentenyl-1-phosphate phosphatase
MRGRSRLMRIHQRYRVFIDFDGTLVEPNVAILLVGKFCPDGARVANEVDQLLHTGKMTLREAWEHQAALLPANRIPEMTRWAVDSIPLRSGAREFLAFLKEGGIPTAIVSGGLDFYIQAILEREGIDVPFLSDTLDGTSQGAVRVLHPYGHPTCRLCGICKAQVIRSKLPAADLTVFLGDGSTDRYGAEVADIVFARHRLKTYCDRAGVPHVAFEDFHEVLDRFRHWVDGSEAPPARGPLGLADSPCPISRDLSSSGSRSPIAIAPPPRLAPGTLTGDPVTVERARSVRAEGP